MTNKQEIETLAKKLWSENEEVATELANVIFGIRDGDYEEPEYEYPIIKKSLDNGSIVKFTALTIVEVIMETPYSFPTGAVATIAVPHTDTDIWKDVPYDKERGLYHGQPIYAWGSDDTHSSTLKFYDAINKCTFTCNGNLHGLWFDKFEAIPPEHIPEWMYESYSTLEGI